MHSHRKERNIPYAPTRVAKVVMNTGEQGEHQPSRQVR
jgi:hypothetical protein